MSNDNQPDLATLLEIQRALIRSMKTIVQTQQVHTQMLEGILERLPNPH